MPTNKRITDLTDYTSVLPYASEIFGVYQPLLGWKSKRIIERMNKGIFTDNLFKFKSVLSRFKGVADVSFNHDHHLDGARLSVGIPAASLLRPQPESFLMAVISNRIQDSGTVPEKEQWRDFIDENLLVKYLNEDVYELYKTIYTATWTFDQYSVANNALTRGLKTESAIAGALSGMVNNGLYDKLKALFFMPDTGSKAQLDSIFDSMKTDFKDPFLSFDPKKDIKEVCLSPVGIVHLYRQFFFELDTFLGTPVSHVWLSPGSTVELIETSSRKTITEKIVETSLESTTRTEKSSTEEDEISEAVKQDNKDDMKLGFSTTVNQSWGTGNASATGSLNMDKTQEVAREQSHKRMRQQTEKLATEIRQNFKSTLRTVTEVTDTSSKRYVLTNSTAGLINYELRRKMRQVGVQIQDIGSYLCWETFVDEPGKQLGLPNLVHIAQPADLLLVPNPKLLPMPPEVVSIGFTGEMVWNFPDNESQHGEDHPGVNGRFVPLNTLDIMGVPNDYEIAYDAANPYITISHHVIAAEDDDSWNANHWAAMGMITADKKRIIVGIVTMPKPSGLAWNDRITFKISGGVTCRLTDAKRDEINKANDALISAKQIADNENQRKQEEAFRKTAQDRITLASKIKKRKFEDLREEERTIVYRNLIKGLMTENNYKNLPETATGYESRHVLSELINAIFDINKMLYFVAPEWWKPRATAKLSFGETAIQSSINGSLINWADQQTRDDNYYITENSEPAPLGSSLGWLLQLDGDDQRNAFLNAPWVKAVIPIRPGKELAAMNWLQNVNIEGAGGLDAVYAAAEDELDAIRTKLLNKDPADPVASHVQVTINDAIRKLCIDVAEKEEASKKVGKYPKEEINDDNKVLSTPIEKVYEHGFYPLQGGFKAKVEEYYETTSQWIEVLPTDQIVPVEVKYDPKTGRQVL